MNIEKTRAFRFRHTIVHQMKNRETGEIYYNIHFGSVTIPRVTNENLKRARVRVPKTFDQLVREKLNRG